MRLRRFAPLVFVLTAVAIFAAPVFRANADPARSGIKTFQGECAVTSTATTCGGNQIGTATFTDSSFNEGLTFGLVGADACFLVAENFVLTTPDGKTLTFETSGTQCNNPSAGNYRRQNTYLITGGTGRFAEVTGGAGNYVVSGLFPASPATIHLDGNIQSP
jgi:hypothetical protein